VASGLTNREAAGSLLVSSRTVDAHLRSIYAKLGVKSRSAATRYAVQNGLG
jgi:DNA-binding CsgD family transcriptional regulator